MIKMKMFSLRPFVAVVIANAVLPIIATANFAVSIFNYLAPILYIYLHAITTMIAFIKSITCTPHFEPNTEYTRYNTKLNPMSSKS